MEAFPGDSRSRWFPKSACNPKTDQHDTPHEPQALAYGVCSRTGVGTLFPKVGLRCCPRSIVYSLNSQSPLFQLSLLKGLSMGGRGGGREGCHETLFKPLTSSHGGSHPKRAAS